MSKLVLLHKDNTIAKVGDAITNFRGESATIQAIHPPKHAGSTGHVTTDLGFHFVSVYGLEFVKQVENFPNPIADPMESTKFLRYFELLCAEHCIYPSVALENDKVVKAVQSRNVKDLEEALTQEF